MVHVMPPQSAFEAQTTHAPLLHTCPVTLLRQSLFDVHGAGARSGNGATVSDEQPAAAISKARIEERMNSPELVGCRLGAT